MSTPFELLPPEVKEERLHLAGLDKAGANLVEIETRQSETITFIKTTNVATKEDCVKMKEAVAALKPYKKLAQALISPYTTILEAAKRSLQITLNKVLNANEEAQGIATRKVNDWEVAEREAAQREERERQKKVDDENRRKAEEQRRADETAAKRRKEEAVAQIRADLKAKKITKRQAEKRLREVGAQEEADKAKAAADAEELAANPPQVKVEPNVEKVAGTRDTRTYSAQCVNLSGFIIEFVKRFNENRLVETVRSVDHNGKPTETQINWLRFICVDEQELNKIARSVKNVNAMEEAIPHIKALVDRKL